MRSMFAVIVAGQTNLLPPNRQPGTLSKFIESHPDSYLLHDGLPSDYLGVSQFGVPQFDVSALHFGDWQAEDVVSPIAISDQQLAALSYTSGSSGESQAIRKLWSTLYEGGRVNADNMLIGAPPALNILATVPSHHMYGLELTITLPLVADVCVHDGQPLLPADVRNALRKLPEPRALVSTPQHLKVLVESGLEFPNVARLYSATAPLSQELAVAVEELFKGELVEIYGCSEIGSIARRRSAAQSSWTPFDAMQISIDEDNELATVTAPHVDAVVELQDILKSDGKGGFTLHGRLGDLVNVGGTRGSLHQLNQQLQAIEGVRDGVVFLPDDNEAADSSQRLAAIVVSDTLDARSLTRALKQVVDAAHIPRPILFTSELPRSDTSKLPRAAVVELYHRLSKDH